MKKNTWIGVGVVIAVIAVIVAYSVGQSSNNQTPSTSAPVSVSNTPQTQTTQAPQQTTNQTQNTTLTTKRDCATDASAFFVQFKSQQLASAKGLNLNETVDDPQYHYNNSMQTCLISLSYTIFGFGGTNDEMFVNQIRDVYSNKIIITGTWSLNGTFQVNLTQAEYTQQSKVLMTQ